MVLDLLLIYDMFNTTLKSYHTGKTKTNLDSFFILKLCVSFLLCSLTYSFVDNFR